MNPRSLQSGNTSDAWEFERKYLLDGMPDLPPHASIIMIEQGYLPEGAPDTPGETRVTGRLRRAVNANGEVALTHTIKTGAGVVRREIERTLEETEFAGLWPLTAGRRLRKTRYCLPDDDGVWEIDEFEDIDLVLAEIELPSADVPVTPPAWLAGHILREVTDEPSFRNYDLARGAARRGEFGP